MSNKKSKGIFTPKLRFPEFQNAPEWENPTLEEVSIPVVERVGDRKLTPISISAGIGFVPQAEKFGRDISGNQYRLYTIVRDGDFVYNKGNSLKFPQGCVYNLHDWGEVAAPNVFICFRLKDGYINNFFQNCFERNMHGVQLKKDITSGARSNGLLNISKDTFFGIRIPTPSTAEQQKIADCLTSLDDLIAAQSQKVEALRAYKKGLMQNLFPAEGETVPRLRFPEFQSAGKWEEKTLGDISTFSSGGTPSKDVPEYWSGTIPWISASSMYDTNITNSELKITDVAVKNGAQIAKKGSLLILVRGSMLYNRVPMGIAAIDVAFNQDVKALKIADGVNVIYLLYQLLASESRIPIHDTGIGAGKIDTDDLKRLTIHVAILPEQQRIAELLTTLDEQITAQSEALAALKVHKKGLMRGLFPSMNEVRE
jgi:type I restriction enzyme S subunit